VSSLDGTQERGAAGLVGAGAGPGV
jgi:hypothetical protein